MNINPNEEELAWEKAQADDLIREEKLEREYWDHVAKIQNEWFAKWPNHCRHCHGWGGFETPGKYSGPPESCYEATWDECDALETNECHRCRGELRQYGSNDQPKCIKCGWSWDDGVPQG